jgi:hypothetical protein
MDWTEILTEVIISVVGLVISGLGALAMYYIKTKVKDEKLQVLLSGAHNVVANGVDFVYQTYVSNLKGTSLWDKEAMENAKAQATKYIENNLSAEMKQYLKSTEKDVVEWIAEQIEITISKDK